MTKNDSWKYASGEIKKPVVIEGDVQSETALKAWLNKDKIAKSDLILFIYLLILTNCNRFAGALHLEKFS